MKFLTYFFVFIFSLQAQAHDDHYLGDGVIHNMVHAVLIFLGIAIVFTMVYFFKRKAKHHKS